IPVDLAVSGKEVMSCPDLVVDPKIQSPGIINAIGGIDAIVSPRFSIGHRIKGKDLERNGIDAIRTDHIEPPLTGELVTDKSATRSWARGGRVINPDQLGARIVGECLGEIPDSLQRGRHGVDHRLRAAVLDLFNGYEEEGLVAPVVQARDVTRPTESSTVLIMSNHAARHAVPVIGKAVCIELVVAQELVKAAVQSIGPRLGDGGEIAAA